MPRKFIKTGMEFAETVEFIREIVVAKHYVRIVFKNEVDDKTIEDVRSLFLIGFMVDGEEEAVRAINGLSSKGSAFGNILIMGHPEGIDVEKCSCVRILHIDGVVREEFFRKRDNRLKIEY